MSKWSIVLNDTLSATLNPPILLDTTHRYNVTLLHGQFSYSWYNISQKLNNNVFYISTNGGGSYTAVTVPDGTWSSCMLIEFITDTFGDNGAVPPVNNILIEELHYNGRWRITTTNNHMFGTGKIGSIIGFADNFIVPLNTPTEGTSSTKFLGLTKGINISCNLVDNQKNYHNKSNTNILFATGIPPVDPFDTIDLVRVMPMPVSAYSTTNINTVSLTILDNNLDRLILHNPNTVFWLEISDAGKIEHVGNPVAST